MKKRRLDVLLVERGLFPTRAKAAAAIMAGQVLLGGRPAAKAGAPAAEDEAVELVKPNPYVSRGGLKLAAVLEAFPLELSGRICLDAGASTGGFTDCLLQRGAAKVYAIDVGTHQLDDRLRQDPRVDSREQLHAKDLKAAHFDPRPTLAVIDVSFISVTQVLPYVLACLKAPYEVLALIKPQFEVGPKLAPKGVVKDPQAHLLAIEKVRTALKPLPVAEAGLFECPVHGPKGNIEFFLHLRSK